MSAFVVRRSNPAFEQPALETRFIEVEILTPASDGIPVSFHLRESFTVHPSIRHWRRRERHYRGNGTDQPSIPPEYRYDVAPKPRGLPSPVYPFALLRDEVSGKARVGFVIGTNGRVISA